MEISLCGPVMISSILRFLYLQLYSNKLTSFYYLTQMRSQFQNAMKKVVFFFNFEAAIKSFHINSLRDLGFTSHFIERLYIGSQMHMIYTCKFLAYNFKQFLRYSTLKIVHSASNYHKRDDFEFILEFAGQYLKHFFIYKAEICCSSYMI